jgi:F0F1-type ATP synthase assembly protein I
MKKALIIITALSGSIVAYAQDKPEPLISRDLIFDLIHVIMFILVVYLISSFILQLVRQNLDFRLKSKIVDRQTDEQIVSQLVQPDKINPLNTLLQWICTLVGVGIGFALISHTQPFGLHSLAIMAFSVAAGLGVYYFIVKRAKN